MKKLKLVLAVSLMMGATLTMAQKNEEKVAFKSSVVCFLCKRTIEYDLTFEKGVKSVNVDLDKKLVEVLYNAKKTNPQALKKRLSRIGYSADEVKADPKGYAKLPQCCKAGEECSDEHEGEHGKDHHDEDHSNGHHGSGHHGDGHHGNK